MPIAARQPASLPPKPVAKARSKLLAAAQPSKKATEPLAAQPPEESGASADEPPPAEQRPPAAQWVQLGAMPWRFSGAVEGLPATPAIADLSHLRSLSDGGPWAPDDDGMRPVGESAAPPTQHSSERDDGEPSGKPAESSKTKKKASAPPKSQSAPSADGAARPRRERKLVNHFGSDIDHLSDAQRRRMQPSNEVGNAQTAESIAKTSAAPAAEQPAKPAAEPRQAVRAGTHRGHAHIVSRTPTRPSQAP